jgi:FkbM family methyltransferase
MPTSFGFKFSGNRAMAAGTYETEEIQVFLKHLRRASICIDIGANIGLYTCLAASLHKHVIAIEPLANNLEILYRNLMCNSFENVEVFPMGLGSTGAVKRLFGVAGCASFVKGWSSAPEESYTWAPVSTIDTIVNTRFNGEPILIKMDVEGFESEVLKGAERTLTLSPKPTWMLEISLTENFPGRHNEKFLKTFEGFWRHGYQAATADARQQIVQPDDVRRWVNQGHVDFGYHNYLFYGC